MNNHLGPKKSHNSRKVIAMNVNNIFKTFGKDWVCLPLIKLDIADSLQNRLLLSIHVMHFRLPAEENTCRVSMKCDCKQRKSESKMSVISRNTCHTTVTFESSAARATQIAKSTKEPTETVLKCFIWRKRPRSVWCFLWQRRRACFLQTAVCHMWQEKVGLSWKWGWAGTGQFPWLVSSLGCHRACRKTCLACLIASLQSCRSWWRVLFSDALSACVSSS